MKKLAIALMVLAVSGWNHGQAQTIVNLDSIQFWVGTGSKRAAMVIDWKDSSATQSSFAWGYRWDGDATGYDMIRSLAGAIGTNLVPATPSTGGDPALTLFTQAFSFGLAVYELRYQSGSTALAEGGFDPSSAGYWAYFTADRTTSLPVTWESSQVGMGDRTLANNSWDAWTWAENFVAIDPSTPIAAVPEPESAWFFLAAAGLAGAAWLRRHRAS